MTSNIQFYKQKKGSATNLAPIALPVRFAYMQ